MMQVQEQLQRRRDRYRNPRRDDVMHALGGYGSMLRRACINSGSAPLTPLTAATGCIGWWEADQHVYEASADLAENADGVTEWRDLSSSAFNLTQAGGDSLEMTYETGVFNGLPGIQGGASRYLANSNILLASGDWTLIFCYDLTAVGGTANYIYWNTNSSSGIATCAPAVGGGAALYFDGAGVVCQCPNTTQTLTGYVLTVIQSGTTITIRANGGTNSASGTAAAARALRNIEFGNRVALNFPNHAEHGGWAAYNSALTGASLNNAEGYWSTKYGITLS